MLKLKGRWRLYSDETFGQTENGVLCARREGKRSINKEGKKKRKKESRKIWGEGKVQVGKIRGRINH